MPNIQLLYSSQHHPQDDNKTTEDNEIDTEHIEALLNKGNEQIQPQHL